MWLSVPIIIPPGMRSAPDDLVDDALPGPEADAVLRRHALQEVVDLLVPSTAESMSAFAPTVGQDQVVQCTVEAPPSSADLPS